MKPALLCSGCAPSKVRNLRSHSQPVGWLGLPLGANVFACVPELSLFHLCIAGSGRNPSVVSALQECIGAFFLRLVPCS